MQSVKQKKILIIGPSWLGDMIMSQALYKVLKSKFNCIIDVVAPEWSRFIVDRMEEVNRSILLPVQHGELALYARYKLGKELRNEFYDWAIVLTNSWKSALIPLWANIPIRTGWLGELRWGSLNDVRYLNKRKFPVMMQRYVALAYAKGEAISKQHPYPKLKVNASSLQQLLKKFNLFVAKRKILALCPGAAYGSAKRWPANYFAELAKIKISEGWDIWLFGSSQDVPVVANISQQLNNNCYNFAGKLQLTETVDLLSVAQVVISNDSGLMHMASSVGKYLIAIYGPTSPIFAPPFSPIARVITKNLTCSPCHKRDCPLGHHACMATITPQQIITMLKEDGW